MSCHQVTRDSNNCLTLVHDEHTHTHHIYRNTAKKEKKNKIITVFGVTPKTLERVDGPQNRQKLTNGKRNKSVQRTHKLCANKL